ncbi:hypothetical protein BFP71_05765 [Roseivirga misakiensis]|uniref:Cell division protein FtsX n=2 Tax=Roseivirga misakiensis TaxID=1563681 RepID=A0A1E5T701_9BACT|nr:hypothetical protein BFP71_05765 [Roseivirga misakiensis]
MMFKNYLTIALRNFKKYSLYSFLNLSGLVVGITSCLLIFLYVRQEYNVDRNFPNAENIYRVVTDMKLGDREIHTPTAPVVLAEHMIKTVPEVENAARLMLGQFNTVVDLEEKQMRVFNVTYATSELLDLFSFSFVSGNPEGALDEPKTMVMSETMSEHLFPGEDAFGKIVTYNSADFIVKGVYKDMSDNAHFKFDLIMSHAYQTSRYDYGWNNLNSYTYLKLKPGTDPLQIESKLNAALETHMKPLMEGWFQVPADEINSEGNHARFYLQPLVDIHLKSNLPREFQANGSIENVRTISLIGIIILLIASINFINLSTARAALRAKEVGVRKVMGSERRQLVTQFLFESSLYSFVAFVLSGLLAFVTLPYFNHLAGTDMTFSLGGTTPLWLVMLIGALVIGIVAGFYPAIVLSSFNPVKSLKGQEVRSGGKAWLRSGLVILQFSVSTFLAICTIVINNQLDYVLDKSLGFEQDDLIILEVMDLNRYDRGETAIINELESSPNIISYSRTDYIPINGSRGEYYVDKIDEQGEIQTVNAQSWPINEAYIPTMGMEVIRGRNYENELASDSNAVIINQSMAQALQMEDPIGQSLQWKVNGKVYNMSVVGVVKDFHYGSMKETIKPLMFYKGYDPWTLSVKFSGSPSEALSTLEGIWSDHSGGQPFIARLASEDYRMLYQKEGQLKGLVNAFSTLAVLVAILGLVGLASFMAEQRQKEMGIRKVLGAKSIQLFRKMIAGFTVLVGIACLIAIPVANWVSSQWLSDYAYRIEISPMIYVMACLIMLVLSWITVSFQSLKVANTNPIDNLRTE